MAITLNGEYIVVEDVTTNSVTIRFHKDEAHRERYKTGTEEKYEGTRQETRSVPVDLSKQANPLESIRDNAITEGYEALKTLEEFSESIDV